MESQFRMTDNSKLPQQPRVTFSRQVLIDEDPDLSYLQQDYSEVTDLEERGEYRQQDADRLATFERGDWSMVGIRAKAEILIPVGGNSFATYTLTSPGLFGVESDRGEEYFAEIYADQLLELKTHIKALAEVSKLIDA